MIPLLIGLTGKRRVGKSTVANEINSYLHLEILSFATPIKRMVTAMGVEDFYVYGDGKEEIIPWLGVTGRTLLQKLGTEFGRDMIHQEIWTNALFRAHHYKMAMTYAGVVIDDVRFPSEAEAIRLHGGVVARIQWGDDETAIIPGHHDDHISEKPLPKVDYVIKNSSDMQSVRAQINEMIIDLREKSANQ